MVDCYTDADCVPDLTQWTEPLPLSVSLVGVACAHLLPGGGPWPLCQCTVHMEPTGSSTQAPFDSVFYPGNRGYLQAQGCSEFARASSCLYCAAEFPGCHLESSEQDCRGICEDLVGRVQQDWERAYAVNVRVARCTSYYCERVIELDGRCHVRDVLADSAGYDCSLSDGELLELGVSYEPTCPLPPADLCTTAEDCPGGLGCGGGVCGLCSDAGAVCASGERCALGLCVPEAQVACSSSFDCAEGENCLLSGVDFKVTRGNEATWSSCVADPRPKCPEVVRDANGNVISPRVANCRP
jgi:hypothetical protein